MKDGKNYSQIILINITNSLEKQKKLFQLIKKFFFKNLNQIFSFYMEKEFVY